ncbi:hypothetical protein [Longimicrobium sp.]|uniref:hypothetical protein n=1 Tax=Longimicrobium sp. TaxID=2029185 RepID=UPI002E328128|nr:hypothetical protein [Longimicrobium sp.]HEX6038683.1 hypothetical protein [Longimicrobium sp.]
MKIPERDPRPAPRWLRACALPACLALATATCDGGVISEPERDPLDVPLSEILELTRTGAAPVRADGASQDTVVARIPDHAFTRRVVFRTTAGKFHASQTREELVTAVRVEGDGDDRLVAKAVLVADTVAGAAAVSATVGDFTQYIAVPFVEP